MDEKKYYGLCFRCEYRALYLEEGRQPRSECGDISRAVYSCYMFQPVKPLVLKKNEGDKRPQFGMPLLAARSHRTGIADVGLSAKKAKNGVILYWEVEEKEEE